jgi:cytochrome c
MSFARLACARIFACILAVAACGGCGGCGDDTATARALTGGDPERGQRLIRHYGCGTCHQIPHVGGATSHVGPSLDAIGSHLYLAGRVTNTPAHLIEWIRHPQAVVPGNVMPDMGVTEADARDIAAFLYTLQ